MSGVWVFKNNGVMRLVENPAAGSSAAPPRRKALVHTPSGEAVCSYEVLEAKLTELGWERYSGCADPALCQFHKRGTVDLISLPKDFNHFSSVHMYDVVVKNQGCFRVVESN